MHRYVWGARAPDASASALAQGKRREGLRFPWSRRPKERVADTFRGQSERKSRWPRLPSWLRRDAAPTVRKDPGAVGPRLESELPQGAGPSSPAGLRISPEPYGAAAAREDLAPLWDDGSAAEETARLGRTALLRTVPPLPLSPGPPDAP